jgi:hypothetical protein
MATPIRVYNNLQLRDSLFFAKNLADFPESPTVGQVVLKSDRLWAYSIIDGFNTWYPLTNRKNSYVHVQGLAATEWVVTHNLNTKDIILGTYSNNDALNYPSITFTSNNVITVNFSEAETGRVVLFAEMSDPAPARGIIPEGGVAGQVLAKTSETDYTVGWVDAKTIETAASVAASTINCLTGSYFYKTITSAITLSFTNPNPTGKVTSFILELTNPGTNVTWPTSVKWNNGTKPTLSVTGKDLLGFITYDNGTTWIGNLFVKGAA